MLRIFCIFLFLIYNNICVGMDTAAKYMVGASTILAGARFVHELTGDIKERIKVKNAQGDLEPLCPCNKNIDSIDDCIEGCCTCSSAHCCCDYKKSNCGACFRWIGGVIDISTAAVALALECASSSEVAQGFSVACSVTSLTLSTVYFIGCCF